MCYSPAKTAKITAVLFIIFIEEMEPYCLRLLRQYIPQMGITKKLP